MIETGRRPLDRRSHIAALAAALKVSETDLVGGPHLSADRQQSDPHMGIAALHESLRTNSLTSPAVDDARPLADLAAEMSGTILPLRRATCDYMHEAVTGPCATGGVMRQRGRTFSACGPFCP